MERHTRITSFSWLSLSATIVLATFWRYKRTNKALEIVSGYEKDVSSIRDGFSAWVKSDPETILKRHLVDAKGANPAFREAPVRKHSPSKEEYRFDADVPNRLTKQKRLSINNWNPATSSRCKNIECLDHKKLTNRFYVTHHGWCAILFNKDTQTSRFHLCTSMIPETVNRRT